MCLYNSENQEILEWDVDGIPTQNPDGILVTLRNHLDARPWVLTAPVVLIERQPKKSEKMIGVMLFLEAYFIIKAPSAKTLWDARHKVPDVVAEADVPPPQKDAITRCEDFLYRGPEVNRKWWTSGSHPARRRPGRHRVAGDVLHASPTGGGGEAEGSS